MRYNDVANGAWYTEAIRWATSQGIVGGYGNGMFGPNDNITREQLAAMLWRYAGSPAATNKELRFNDADEISGFALERERKAAKGKLELSLSALTDAVLYALSAENDGTGQQDKPCRVFTVQGMNIPIYHEKLSQGNENNQCLNLRKFAFFLDI